MLEKLIIDGGRPLQGSVRISGAKNAALPILASTILSGEPCTIHNVPRLRDVDTIIKLLELFGARVDRVEDRVTVHCPTINSVEAPYDLVRTMRASVLFLGPMIARMQRAKISMPGGCAIGARPINLHLHGFNRMGCDVRVVGGYVEMATRGLVGDTIYLDTPTVTGTMNIMMAATLAQGTTVIENAAREPEVIDLANFLTRRGAEISGAGDSIITIQGVERLSGGEHTIVPDRIETGTYLVAGAMTRGRVRLENVRRPHVQAVIDKLSECGAQITYDDAAPTPWIELAMQRRATAVDIETQPFPGFATDMQAQFMALMATAQGSATITENIFENRFMHVSELQRMGARLKIKGNAVFVEGVATLSAAPVMATDLRASAGLVLAALAARGRSEVLRIYHLDRGYEAMDVKLRQLGAHIERCHQ